MSGIKAPRYYVDYSQAHQAYVIKDSQNGDAIVEDSQTVNEDIAETACICMNMDSFSVKRPVEEKNSTWRARL